MPLATARSINQGWRRCIASRERCEPLDLRGAHRVGAPQHRVDFRIFEIDLAQLERDATIFFEVGCLLDDRERPQDEEIELAEADVFDVFFVPADDDDTGFPRRLESE